MVLFTAMTALWLRSYWATERFGFERGGQFIVTGLKGRVQFDCDWPARSDDGGFHVTWPESVSVGYGLDSFYFSHGSNGKTRGVTLMAPCWAVCLLWLLPPVACAIGFHRRRRRRRNAPDTCRSCGYDLRATPHRCPECGTVPVRKAAR
jgi:hypothetical protein